MTVTIHDRLYDLFLIRLFQDQCVLFLDASGTDIIHLDWYLIPAADAMDSFSLRSPHADSWRRRWHPTPVLLPGKVHGQRSLVGCSPWGRGELDTTEWLHFHFSLSCIGEGNGNPLQCSCLENPRDGAAWWAAVSGVAQSRTQLKWLSSSSNSSSLPWGKRE